MLTFLGDENLQVTQICNNWEHGRFTFALSNGAVTKWNVETPMTPYEVPQMNGITKRKIVAYYQNWNNYLWGVEFFEDGKKICGIGKNQDNKFEVELDWNERLVGIKAHEINHDWPGCIGNVQFVIATIE